MFVLHVFLSWLAECAALCCVSNLRRKAAVLRPLVVEIVRYWNASGEVLEPGCHLFCRISELSYGGWRFHTNTIVGITGELTSVLYDCACGDKDGDR